MPDAIQPSLFRRIRFTPMRDVVRGRLTGRLDVDRLIQSSSLPTPARQLISRILRKTGLWRAEKVDVANELIAHFTDGIDAGTSVEELIQAFGDEADSARLIRRAKIRNRPLTWHIRRAFGWLTAILALIYIIFALQFLLRRPTPSINYIERLNRRIVEVPEDRRAWPIYRQAMHAMQDPPIEPAEPRFLNGTRIPNVNPGPSRESWVYVADARPGSNRWPDMVAWLKKHADSLALARQASALPSFGFVLGSQGSVQDRELWPNMCALENPTTGLDEPVRYILLPHLNHVRTLGQQLAADARLALEERDVSRLQSNLLAIWNLANQLRQDEPFVVSQLVANAIAMETLIGLDCVLVQSPELLSNEELQTWAHRLSEPELASDLFHIDGERMAFLDTVQRVYTDDGEGDGQITYEGLRELAQFAPAPKLQEPLTAVTSPVIAASRRNVTEQFNQFIDEAEHTCGNRPETWIGTR